MSSRNWLQIAGAVMLSLATVCSAWCGYQSKLWGGVQMVQLVTGMKALQQSSADNIIAVEARAFDAGMFFSYVEAKNRDDQRQAKFLFDRFPSEMKKAVEAWLATDPVNNRAAPQGPFEMKEYAQPRLQEAQRQQEQATEKFAAAQQAHHTSDTYVLFTVMFAFVLFFGGLSTTLDWFHLRTIMLTLALTLFVVTVAFLATMPICHE
jgi:hypothetical protein